MSTLKIISALLCYPDSEILSESEWMIDRINQEALLPPEKSRAVDQFIKQLAARDLMDAQADYVETFDRGRQHSLLLFEHVHGESRDRGQAMVDLMKVYHDNGYEVSANELPDYIPLFLEYLSQRPADEALTWLADVQPIFGLLAVRLKERENPYYSLFEALLSLVEENIDLTSVEARVRQEVADDTPEAIDAIWEEEAVRFSGSPEEQGCSGGSNQTQQQTIAVESIKRRT